MRTEVLQNLGYRCQIFGWVVYVSTWIDAISFIKHRTNVWYQGSAGRLRKCTGRLGKETNTRERCVWDRRSNSSLRLSKTGPNLIDFCIVKVNNRRSQIKLYHHTATSAMSESPEEVKNLKDDGVQVVGTQKRWQ